MAYRKQYPYTCCECSGRADEDTEKCSWRHCSKLFCASCQMRCHECGDIICAEHSRVVGTEPYCLSCADQLHEHYEQTFELLRMASLRSEGCPDCRGTVIDDSDPFGDRDVEETYACTLCGLSATKKRTPSEALRTAQALRYTGAAALPDAEYCASRRLDTTGQDLGNPQYLVVEGSMPAKRKPAAVELEERISA